MSAVNNLVRGFYRLLLPTVVLLVIAFFASSIWLVYQASVSPKLPYLLTPEKYGLLSTRAAKVTDEKWSNRDGSTARGWLLRGRQGAPAVILLHRYGTDRSWVLNLGVKLNEGTDFTVLMPDLRGHGENPIVPQSSLGGNEAEDILSAMDYLKTLKSEDNSVLVNDEFGLYGVELGAVAAISATAKEPRVKALVADSVPLGSDDVLAEAIEKKFPFASFLTSKIAAVGTYPYFYNGGYNRDLMCNVVKKISNRKVLLMATNETPHLQSTTGEIAECFPAQANLEKNLDLMPSGYNIMTVSNDQTGTYDLRVIDFFKKSLLTNNE